ncbi:uncharacterized protein LOC142162690 [Nicotiana tabacum]|uniref:Uncharacterized protein LOC142162690 n=1 Tax=Nicotiana tabacum TaxID=4097 RepID=A0AC58RRF9_TOBAC
MVETQFTTSVKCTRSDNGLEFTRSEATLFFQSKGIEHQRTCPYTLQQNGIVERKHEYLLETAMALLFQAKLPLKYWGECVLTTTFLINRLPTVPLKNKCPFKLLYGKKPNYSHLRSFGCLCYPTIPKPHRDKFEPRASPHVFVGYSFGVKGYNVLSLNTKKIFVSRDVVFHESIFPFSLPSVSVPSSSLPHTAAHHDYSDVFPSYPTHSVTTPQRDVSVTPISMSPNHTILSPIPMSPNHTIHSSLIPNTTSPQTTSPITSRINQLYPSTLKPNQRVSSRVSKVPSYLSEYVCSVPNLKQPQNVEVTQTNSPFSLNAHFTQNNHITPDVLSPDSQQVVRNICNDIESFSYEEVAGNPTWQQAMTQEFEALYANNTWTLVLLPAGKQSIG